MSLVFPLRGAKTSLSLFTPDDISDEYIGWLNDPAVVRYSNQRFLTHSRESCARYLASFQGTANLFLAVRPLDDAALIGTMTAYFQQHHGTVDIGIMLGTRQRWGHGLGQDAWNLLLDRLLALPEVRKVTAGTLACNLGMAKLMERSGMCAEGRRVAQELVDGEAQDIVLFAKFK